MKQILTSETIHKMARTSFMFFFTMLVYACGSGSDTPAVVAEIDLRQTCERDSVYEGEWEDSDLEQLVLRGDCTGRENRCQMTFKYYKPVNGRVLLDVEASFNHPGCLQPGEHECAIEHDWTDNRSTEYLRINCGGEDVIYFPQYNVI